MTQPPVPADALAAEPPHPKITLDVLGPVRVGTRSELANRQQLSGPRRLAALAYLALARPRGLHSRDTLVAMLWPEADQASGRHALRNALHAIRQSLGDDVIVTAGDGLVGIDQARLECDGVLLENDIAEGRTEAAVARYHGELLQGFHVSDAPDFERWLDAERARVATLVLDAAWSLVESCRARGDLDGAVAAARKATALAPDDEPSLRRMLALLDDSGDRAAAIRSYEEFAERLKNEYEVEPSADTQAAVRRLREAPLAADVDAAALADPRVLPRPATPTQGAAVPISSSPIAPQSPVRRNGRWLAVAALVLLVAAGTLAFRRRSLGAAPKLSARSLVVLPMDNETGDRGLDYIAAGVGEDVARRLEGIGGITVRSGARSAWPQETRHDFKAITSGFGSTILLKTALRVVGDSLEVRASVIDGVTLAETPVTARRFTTVGLRDAESELAASVAGALFRVPISAMPQGPAHAIDPESYRLTLQGWYALLSQLKAEDAKRLFQQAIAADQSNSRAWAGLSSALSNQTTTEAIPFEDGYTSTEAAALHALAIDTLDGTALSNLGFIRAMRFRSLATGMELVDKAAAVDPSNAEVFLVKAALYRHAGMWREAIDAIRVAHQLDPITPYLAREAAIQLCADHSAEALKLIERQIAATPNDPRIQMDRVRMLARVGRFDDAIAAWRQRAATVNDQPLMDQLLAAHGSAGFWAATHFDGKRRLSVLEQKAARVWVSPSVLMRARFGAGDTTAGYAALAAVEREKDPSLYRLRCQPDFDELRGTEHFDAVVKRVGGLPLK